MKKHNLCRRTLLLVVGLLIMAYGVAFSIKAGLGTSPISSLPYAVSELSALSVGTATIVMHATLVLLQIIILRREYQLVQLFQLPVALLFGCMTDLTLWSMQSIAPQTYVGQWVCCLVGIVLVGIGVSCEVTADVIPLAGEGFILAVCKKFSRPFPSTKVCFDCTLVALACIVGLLCQGTLIGVREGTVAAALLVGMVSKQITKQISKIFQKSVDKQWGWWYSI